MKKTESSLFNRFISRNNFYSAWQRVRQKDAGGGVDEITVARFDHHAEQRLEKVRRDIEQERYIPQPVRSVSIPKFNDAGEWRELGLPTILDKVVQMAMVQVLEPILESIFLPSNFAYRPGKGHRRAIERVNSLLAGESSPWIVRQDIDDFFDSLDHRILLDLVASYVNDDQRLLELIALWCRNGVVSGNGAWRDRLQGVRQGHVIAPLLANLYLHSLDGFAESIGCGWVRYADDYLAVCNSKQAAYDLNDRLDQYIREHLGLVLNRNNCPVTDIAAGFTFLGIHFRHDSRSIAESKIRKMKKKIRWAVGKRSNASVQDVFAHLHETAAGWRRFYGFIDPVEQFREIDRQIEQQLRDALPQKVQAGIWPNKTPLDLDDPFINPARNEKEARTRLNTLWQQALSDQTGKVLKACDRKTVCSRRRYTATNQCGQIVVSSPGYFIGKSGKRLVVRQGRKNISETPIHHVRHLLLGCRGQSLSTDVIRFCLDNGVAIHFIDERGNIYATMQQPGSERTQLAVLQIERRNEPAGLDIARAIIRAKMKNQFGVLKYFAKYNGGNRKIFCTSLEENKSFMSTLIKKTAFCSREKSPAEQRQHLMGIEGVFAGRYWQLFSMLLPENISFPGRKKRGASDLVNSMLNYGYGILYSMILHAINLAGLNPEIGFIHCSRNRRPALSLDLIEMFRAPVVDRTVVSLLNRKTNMKLNGKGLLTDESRKKTAQAVLQGMRREITWKGARMSLTDVMQKQAKLLCLHLEGKKAYTPYLYKW